MSKSILTSKFDIIDNEKNREKFKEMTGKIMLNILEGNHMGKISDDVNLPPWEIEHNIYLMLHTLKCHVGLKRYLKILFMK